MTRSSLAVFDRLQVLPMELDRFRAANAPSANGIFSLCGHLRNPVAANERPLSQKSFAEAPQKAAAAYAAAFEMFLPKGRVVHAAFADATAKAERRKKDSCAMQSRRGGFP